MKDFSYITNASPEFIENLYQDYVKNPETVDPEYRKFFEGFDFAVSTIHPNGNGAAVSEKKVTTAATPVSAEQIDWLREVQVYRLILGYRNKGHLIAKTNPIRERKDRGANLDLSFFGFTENDLDKNFHAGSLIGLGITSLRNILNYLKRCYASNVGIEFKYISDQKKVDFLTNEIEKKFLDPLPLEKRKRILDKLNEGVIFEKFLHTKYVGQKRF
jgi:2-oxoglutarate dehydrogenase E1 component